MTPLVSIETLSKHFGVPSAPAIATVSASIKPGQVTGLVGPDGAGKTTLIRLIAALLTPSEGRVNVCGLDTIRDTSAVHASIGYMPQRFGLYEDLSVMENLVLYAELKGVELSERKAIFDKLLAFTALPASQTVSREDFRVA